MTVLLPFVAALPFALIGVHLWRVARGSGALSDRLLASFFLLLAVGIVPRIFAVDLATSGAAQSPTVFGLNAIANVLVAAGIICLASFSWQVFRPTARWAKNFVIGFTLSISATVAAGMRSVEAGSGSGPAAIALNVLGSVALGWCFLECVIYYRRLRKRLALGLIDPVVANRFLLWSIWTGCITLQAILMAGLRAGLWWSGDGILLARGLAIDAHWLGLIQATKATLFVIGPTIAASVYLSFSPPARYRRWLASRRPAIASP